MVERSPKLLASEEKATISLSQSVGDKANSSLCKSHVRIAVSDSNLHDMANVIIEKPGEDLECSCQIERHVTRTALICVTVFTGVGETDAHATFLPNIG